MRNIVVLIALCACASNPVRREAMVEAPVILPNRMCAAHGKVAVSTDKPGERMICELQEPLGSHLPKCACWDEGSLALKRGDTQDWIREVMPSQCGSAQTCPQASH